MATSIPRWLQSQQGFVIGTLPANGDGDAGKGVERGNFPFHKCRQYHNLINYIVRLGKFDVAYTVGRK